MMRPLIIASTAFALLNFGSGPVPARAETYRWCAQVASNGAPSCYFATFEKCRAYIIASGGACFSRALAQPANPEAPRQSAARAITASSPR
jgi:hypothetical protein